MAEKNGYHDVWVFLQSPFSNIYKFSGGTSFVYPGTSRVDIEFSVIVQEKDKYRITLMDFYVRRYHAHKAIQVLTVYLLTILSISSQLYK